MRLLAIALFAVACASPRTTSSTLPPEPTVTAPADPVASLAWWTGSWQGADGSEHWIAIDGGLHGIALQDRGAFEALIVDDTGDGLVLTAMPGGGRPVEFRRTASTDASVTFTNPMHDRPKTIVYERTPEGLRATLDPGGREIVFAFRAIPEERAPELEEADRAFAADTSAKGLDGLMSWFAPDGWMWSKDGKVTGDALRATWAKRLSAGMLTWEPVASARRGTIGFTVGRGQFTGKDPANSRRTTYITIWKQQPDGAWRVLFDTGRAVPPSR